MLSRGSHLERVGRWLARREPELQVRLARELVSTIRGLNRTIAELDRELEQRTTEVAPALLELPGEGKSRSEALRCLKRLLVRAVFNTLKTPPP